MIIGFAVFTVNFLSSDYLCCNTVCMNPFIFTFASLYWTITDPQKLQVLSLVFIITFELGKENTLLKSTVRQPHDDAITVNHKDWLWSLT